MKTNEIIALTAIQLAYKWDAASHIQVQYNPTSKKFHTFLSVETDSGEVSRTEVKTLQDLASLCDAEKTYVEAGDDKVREDWIFRTAIERIRAEKAEHPDSFVPVLSDSEKESGVLVLQVLKIFPAWNEVVTISYITREWDGNNLKFITCVPSYAAMVDVGMLFRDRAPERIRITAENLSVLQKACVECIEWEHPYFNQNILKAWLFGLLSYPELPLNPRMKDILPAKLLNH